jgi:hypothetical protein
MTRDEWNQVLATKPATGPQVGAIIAEFERLGVADRSERLAISAELLGLEELGSTTDLVMGDAGRLVATLRRTRHRGELPDVTAADVDEDLADEHDSDDRDENERITFSEAIIQIVAMVYAACHGKGNLAF